MLKENFLAEIWWCIIKQFRVVSECEMGVQDEDTTRKFEAELNGKIKTFIKMQ